MESSNKTNRFAGKKCGVICIERLSLSLPPSLTLIVTFLCVYMYMSSCVGSQFCGELCIHGYCLVFCFEAHRMHLAYDNHARVHTNTYTNNTEIERESKTESNSRGEAPLSLDRGGVVGNLSLFPKMSGTNTEKMDTFPRA